MDFTPLVQFLALILTALALVPDAAHVLEFPNKLPLSREAYLTVQQVYRGWQFAGVVAVAALIATLILVFTTEGDAFAPALIAFLAIVGAQAIYWAFTYPVNRLTQNWTQVPDDWERLRDRWELSHVAAAMLNLIAVVCVAACIVRS